MKIRVIGRGALGKVFLVKHIKTGKHYAMKKMRKDLIMQNDQKDRIMEERKIISLLDNPYIVKLCFSFQTETSLYLIMDFINGGELFTHLDNHKKHRNEMIK